MKRNYKHTPELAGKITLENFAHAADVEVIFDVAGYQEMHCLFKDAFFCLEGSLGKEFIVVYTEHCGYHIFMNTEDITVKYINEGK